MGPDKAVAPLVLESEVKIAMIFWILFNVNFTRDSEPDKYFKREAAKSKGSGLSGPGDREESSSVPCLALKKKIDAETNVGLAPPIYEVDATSKNKQPSQKALDLEKERRPQAAHAWHEKN